MIKNVIIVCDYGYVDGGASQIAHNTAIKLRDNGLNVVFFCAVGEICDTLKNSSVETICLGQEDILHEKNKIKAVLRGINNKLAKKEFAKLLSKYNPDETIIHVHNWTKAISSSIFEVASKMRFKIVLTVHDYFLVCPNGGLYNYKKKTVCSVKPMSFKCLTCNCDVRSYPQKVFRILRQGKQNRNIRKCDDISYIFISDFSKRLLESKCNFDKEKVFFLQNPIGFGNQIDNRIECENNDIYVFIGRISEEKGIRLFCEAVTKSKVKGVVIGDGPLLNELKVKYPNIEFTGWLLKNKISEYLKNTRCLIFPSLWYEVSPLTPIEVMGRGIPVICSTQTATSEMLSEEQSVLFENGDIQSLCKAVELTKQKNVVEKMSKSIFNSFDYEKFSSEKYVKNLLSIYTEIIG